MKGWNTTIIGNIFFNFRNLKLNSTRRSPKSRPSPNTSKSRSLIHLLNPDPPNDDKNYPKRHRRRHRNRPYAESHPAEIRLLNLNHVRHRERSNRTIRNRARVRKTTERFSWGNPVGRRGNKSLRAAMLKMTERTERVALRLQASERILTEEFSRKIEASGNDERHNKTLQHLTTEQPEVTTLETPFAVAFGRTEIFGSNASPWGRSRLRTWFLICRFLLCRLVLEPHPHQRRPLVQRRRPDRHRLLWWRPFRSRGRDRLLTTGYTWCWILALYVSV